MTFSYQAKSTSFIFKTASYVLHRFSALNQDLNWKKKSSSFSIDYFSIFTLNVEKKNEPEMYICTCIFFTLREEWNKTVKVDAGKDK